MHSKIAEPVTRSLPTYPTMPHMHLKIDAPTALTNPQMVRALVCQVDTPPPPPIFGLRWAGQPGLLRECARGKVPGTLKALRFLAPRWGGRRDFIVSGCRVAA